MHIARQWVNLISFHLATCELWHIDGWFDGFVDILGGTTEDHYQPVYTIRKKFPSGNSKGYSLGEQRD